MFSLLFLLLFINEYEYQLDPVIAECDSKYGACCWEFLPILRTCEVQDTSLNLLPNVFSGNLVDGTCQDTSRYIPQGIIWENNARDTSCLVVKYKQSNKTRYKIFWFVKTN